MKNIQINNNQIEINEELARRLVSARFAQWKDLSVQIVIPGGWDNNAEFAQSWKIVDGVLADYRQEI